MSWRVLGYDVDRGSRPRRSGAQSPAASMRTQRMAPVVDQKLVALLEAAGVTDLSDP